MFLIYIRAVSKGQRGDASHKAFHMFYVQGWNNADKISDYHWAIMLTSVNYIIKWTKSGLQTASKANMIRETLHLDFIAIKKQFSMHATAHNRSTCVDVQCNWKLTCGHKKNETKQTKTASKTKSPSWLSALNYLTSSSGDQPTKQRVLKKKIAVNIKTFPHRHSLTGICLIQPLYQEIWLVRSCLWRTNFISVVHGPSLILDVRSLKDLLTIFRIYGWFSLGASKREFW